MSSSSPPTKSASTHAQTSEPKPPRQRLPPPTLFQAPPTLSLSLSRSPNASHVSLPSLLPTNTNANHPTTTSSHRPPPSNPQTKHPGPAPDTDTNTHADADALWLSMQHTLAEVELTAASARNLHVFGPQHAAALAQLRGAQIALAQAWARGGGGEGEGEDGVVVEDPVAEKGPSAAEMAGGGKGTEGKEGTGAGPGTGNGNGNGNGAKGRPRRGSKLAEETRNDILLARKRREANDRYFARVSAGVEDVVGRLEGVAGAMRAVERESRDVWSSSGESSVGTSASASVSASGG